MSSKDIVEKNISEFGFDKILVSVVVPVYNVECYLEECVKSILKQTYTNIEIILVDDGSKDSSGVLCDKLAESDERIIVIHKENGGLSDARNRGVLQATGAYIMFVDSDDEIDSHIIEIMLGLALKTTSDITICDPVHVFGEEEIAYTVCEKCVTYSSVDAICEMWYQRTFLVSAWAKMYKRNLLIEHPFRVGILYEDVDVMHKIFWGAKKIVYNPSKLYAYRHRDNSITTKKFTLRDCEILNICERLESFTAGKEICLKEAAIAYGVVGAFRVFLNAPTSEEFQLERRRAKKIIDENWKAVLKNGKVRLKTKMGLLIYKFCRPLIHMIYTHINRWK